MTRPPQVPSPASLAPPLPARPPAARRTMRPDRPGTDGAIVRRVNRNRTTRADVQVWMWGFMETRDNAQTRDASVPGSPAGSPPTPGSTQGGWCMRASPVTRVRARTGGQDRAAVTDGCRTAKPDWVPLAGATLCKQGLRSYLPLAEHLLCVRPCQGRPALSPEARDTAGPSWRGPAHSKGDEASAGWRPQAHSPWVAGQTQVSGCRL